SGLFILPAIAFVKTGPALFLSYILASFLAVPTVLSKAELVTAMPKAGGDYFYISRSMGSVAGVIGGLSSWFSLGLKGAFALIGMAAYVELVLPIPIKPLALSFCFLFIILNFLGIKEAAKWQVTMVLGLFAALLFYVSFGFPSIHIEKYVPFAPFGLGSIFATAGLVFISYGGLVKVASIAEEIKNPGRNIPLGMILSLIIVGIFYGLVVFVTAGLLPADLLPADQLKLSLTPISDAAKVFSGGAGVTIMAVAALLAFATTANASIMSSSRYPLAMSRDRLLPAFFERINAKFKTPHYAIFFTGAVMSLAIWFLKLEFLVKIASALLILLYILANVAVIIMRESKIQSYRPKFRSPLYPGIQIAGILGCGFLLVEMGGLVLSFSALFIAAGLVWYLIYARAKVERRSALMHVIQRITAKEIAGTTLQSELKEILIERDEIIEDRFDHLIKNCEILDIDYTISAEEIFRKVVDTLSQRIGIDEKTLFDLFMERERQTSTVIAPGLAIPHVIVKGVQKFDILLVRCKEGIIFPDIPQPVHTMFVLVGSPDERNFYLRALAAIAQIAQDKDFDKNWLKARNIEELRDIILLAERRRIGVI
ncbi:amino acid permease, partial [bacterium]|nr:amino acid permease [bacterium]